MSTGGCIGAYVLVGIAYALIYGLVLLPGLSETIFVGLFWPLEVVRVIARGARDWWRS